MVDLFVARQLFRGAWTRLLIVALAMGACSRNSQPDIDADFPREPIAIHVRNENFLDVNVAVVAGGLSRRLGQVTGNSAADFTIPWSLTNGQQVILTATPIGGTQRYTSQGLTVGTGQMIEFRVGSVLRQSSAVVREP